MFTTYINAEHGMFGIKITATIKKTVILMK